MGLCYYQQEEHGLVFLYIKEIKAFCYEPVCRALVGFIVDDYDEAVVIANISLEEAEPLMEQYFKQRKIDLRQYSVEVMNPEAMWAFSEKYWGPEIQRRLEEYKNSNQSEK